MSAWGKAFGFAWGNAWGAVGGVVLRAELRKAAARRWQALPARLVVMAPMPRRGVVVSDTRRSRPAAARRWLIRG